MIGNDVVDILQSRQESNWQRKGFLEKLFTAEEQFFIQQDSNPEIMVWLFWSMKEAAYKIYNRETKRREYIPKKLICKILSDDRDYITGEVNCGENIYHTKSTIVDDSIHTIAVRRYGDLNNVIEIKKTGIFKDQYGIPYLSNGSKPIKNVSVSNHGRFEKIVTIV
ncbi:4'-phosphopantetheinyl transferase family protein [Flavobacterium hibisci]|uniref:4'-phosphopantetheinyl transferase family protein n=1 Tax=Flavobacterium hibisci TaxID=1914462 RepID=UPI001CBB7EA8|nr:4'-phosphopantetheinyl transferase superfamily protein [Flavobacterium hibisci]MBZ4041025.1 4'-phosphopantetheinyl transferase superfamily protein [Flavobacterium hibisci]